MSLLPPSEGDARSHDRGPLHTQHMPPQPGRTLATRTAAIGSGLYKDCRAPWPFQTRRICVKDDGRALRSWHHRHLTWDSSGADSRERRRINAHDRPQAAAKRAALEGQPTAAPRCACLKSLGDGGQRHRPPSTRAHVSWRTSRCGGRAVLKRRKHEVTSSFGPGAGHRARPCVGQQVCAADGVGRISTPTRSHDLVGVFFPDPVAATGGA